jgi:hypothetical protein
MSVCGGGSNKSIVVSNAFTAVLDPLSLNKEGLNL